MLLWHFGARGEIERVGSRDFESGASQPRDLEDCSAQYWVRSVLKVLQARHVDDKAIFHVTLQDALIGLVDLAHPDHLDIRYDAVLGAVVEHFLSFPNASDQ
jgi:hypothetical protein